MYTVNLFPLKASSHQTSLQPTALRQPLLSQRDSCDDFPSLVSHRFLMTLPGIEHLLLKHFPQQSYFISRCSPPSKSYTYTGSVSTSIPSMTQDINCMFSEDHNLYWITSCLWRPLVNYQDMLSKDDRAIRVPKIKFHLDFFPPVTSIESFCATTTNG